MAEYKDCSLFTFEKEPNSVEQAVCHVWTFLKDFIPLANTHGAEFLSHKHWETFIPSSIGDRLQTLDDKELASLPLGKCAEDPGNWKTRATDCKMYDDTRKCINGKDQLVEHYPDAKDLLSLRPDVPDEVPTALSESNGLKDDFTGMDLSPCHHGLDSVVSTAVHCHVENLGILTSREEALGCRNNRSIISESMSEKKSHEVQLMSSAIATIVGSCQADLVVDVGSGKGYLSLELADHQKIAVLGLDSCATNTHGAEVRKERLKPRWQGLVAKEEKNKNVCADKDHETKPDEGSQKHISDGLDTKILPNSSSGCENTVIQKTKEAVSSLYVPLTVYVDPQMNLRQTVAQHAAHLCSGNCRRAEEARLVLTGLHTCGSLAVSTMRLFTKDPGCVAMCCVGCCYQLMEEENTNQSVGFEKDFPLSKYGKSLGLHLGRNARNLASQSVHRLQTSQQLQGNSFYWRALLDVLLHDLSLPVPERIIGMRKLNKQCKTFHEYASRALKKLSLDPDLVTPEMAQALEAKYEQEQKKMAAFFQFKLILAPVIESLILLDRLLFLREQDSVGKAFLVQLFDPVTSPRCYAIVAYKADHAERSQHNHPGGDA